MKEFFKKNGNARRLFGKKEIGIILRQLDGVDLTQSEKNRLSRDIRPKLEVIRELGQLSGEFELKKDQGTKRMVEKAVESILEDGLRDRIKAILLFGSHAGGIVTPSSDIDICVVFDEISREAAERFRVRTLGNFSRKLDLQVFNTLPQKLKRAIARNHKILYRKEGFDNTEFTIMYLKDEDYFLRLKRIFGAAA